MYQDINIECRYSFCNDVPEVCANSCGGGGGGRRGGNAPPADEKLGRLNCGVPPKAGGSTRPAWVTVGRSKLTPVNCKGSGRIKLDLELFVELEALRELTDLGFVLSLLDFVFSFAFSFVGLIELSALLPVISSRERFENLEIS